MAPKRLFLSVVNHLVTRRNWEPTYCRSGINLPAPVERSEAACVAFIAELPAELTPKPEHAEWHARQLIEVFALAADSPAERIRWVLRAAAKVLHDNAPPAMRP
jgi:hypothetical protein